MIIVTSFHKSLKFNILHFGEKLEKIVFEGNSDVFLQENIVLNGYGLEKYVISQL